MAALELGGSLQPFEYEISNIQPNNCLIEISHCGVCYSDINLINDDWKVSTFPLVPGHEIIGKILEIGSEVTHLKEGDHVGVGWQRSSCLSCRDCLLGNENICQVNMQLTAGQFHGGFSTHILMDSRFTFKIPEELKAPEAASLLCAGAAVYRGLKSGGMRSGGHIGILGLGGLGHLAVQYASKLGNQVTVFEYSEDKIDLAEELGADEVILTSKKLPRSLTRPLDLILNTVNKSLDWRSYMRLLDRKGTLMLLASGPEVNIPFASLVYQQKSVSASLIAGRADIQEALEMAEKFNVRTYYEEFSLNEVNIAIEKLKNNQLKYRGVLKI